MRVVFRDILTSTRPQQWVKNVLVFAAVVFTGQMFEPLPLLRSLVAFILFCLLAGAGYLINDVVDKKQDGQHPRKCLRPIASGQLSKSAALGVAGLLILFGTAAGFLLGAALGATLVGYVILTVAYSAALKRLLAVNVIVLPVGYVLRVLAGGFSIQVLSTPWSLICTFFLALFVVIGKRLSEWRLLQDAVGRPDFSGPYFSQFLNHAMLLAATATITAYALFTSTSGHDRALMVTIPFVVYGVLRYLYLVYVLARGDSPEQLVLEDRPLLLTTLLWGVSTLGILYG